MHSLIVLATAVALLCASPATGDSLSATVTNLTNHRRMDVSPAWSPDGTRIAFETARDNVSPYNATEIYVMGADGSDPTRLTFTDSVMKVLNGRPAWSPDGSRIAFWSNRDGTSEIYVMDADGSHQERLTHDQAAENRNPAWSPDGSRIVFASKRDGAGDLHIMDADGSNRVPLTDAARDDEWPLWSPDGDAIAFNAYDGDQWDIYLLTVSTGALVNLTDHPARDMLPTWSPDGMRIAFSSGRDPLPREDPMSDAPGDIWAMDRDGGNLIRLTHNPQFEDVPAWSPDGSKIAFRKLTHSGSYDIFLLDLSTTSSVDSATWGGVKSRWLGEAFQGSRSVIR